MVKEKFCCKKCESRLYAKEVPIFKLLSNEQLEEVIKIRKHIHLKKSENLFLEGEELSKLFIISEGAIKIFKNTSEGKEKIINVLSVGDFFGETNILGTKKVSNISATAIKDTEICTISKSDLEELIKRNPSIALSLLEGLSERLEKFQNLSITLSDSKPEKRIACMLIEFIDKYSFYENEELVVELPLKREEMANYCGIARETLSRKLSSFEKRGILKLGTKKIIILEKNLLEDLIL